MLAVKCRTVFFYFGIYLVNLCILIFLSNFATPIRFFDRCCIRDPNLPISGWDFAQKDENNAIILQ